MAKTFASNLAGLNDVPPSLPSGAFAGGRVRAHTAIINLSGQKKGDTIVVGHKLAGDVFLAALLSTSRSLGSSTLALGDQTSPTRYRGAVPLTNANTPWWVGNTSAVGTVDATGGEILATIGVADLPTSGRLTVTVLMANT